MVNETTNKTAEPRVCVQGDVKYEYDPKIGINHPMNLLWRIDLILEQMKGATGLAKLSLQAKYKECAIMYNVVTGREAFDPSFIH